MNEKTRKQIENLKNQTIGVEIEMNHITRDRAAKIAADFFGTRRYENTANRNGYCTWSAWDAQRIGIGDAPNLAEIQQSNTRPYRLLCVMCLELRNFRKNRWML